MTGVQRRAIDERLDSHISTAIVSDVERVAVEIEVKERIDIGEVVIDFVDRMRIVVVALVSQIRD